jgi:hypothetical protein
MAHDNQLEHPTIHSFRNIFIPPQHIYGIFHDQLCLIFLRQYQVTVRVGFKACTGSAANKEDLARH